MGPYEYFEHDADVGVIGRGATVEAAFVAAAEATFALMTDLDAVRPVESVAFTFEEADIELAFVTWLNRLLAEAHDRGLALSRFGLRREGDRWMGEARGEPWREDLERGTGVKGATLTALAVRQTQDGWDARCIVDV